MSHAGSAGQFSLQVPYHADAASIDGDLSDPVWQHAAVATLNYETRPAENAPAPVVTEARVYASETTLYVAFSAKDPNPNAIRAHLRPRDDIWGEDLVGLKLDTFNNARLAYNFFVNPLGVQLDSIENELTKEESKAWDGIWDSAGRITDEGYEVEIAIPLSQLSFEDKPGSKQWGFELIRFYPRNTEHRLSSHKISRSNSCQLCQLGVVSGFEAVDLGKGLQLTPSLVAKGSREREQAPDSEWQDDNNVDAGLDLRWAINPSALVNATINPDFSQVEADAGQLNVNSNFTLFFEEKRAFFLDNKDYFDSQVALLHTRNIADPDYGVKFTQKSENHTLAFLGTNDNGSHFLVPGNLSSTVASLDEESHNLAARYLYTSSEALAIGAVVTGKKSDNYHNMVVSADVKYQPTAQDTLIAQLATSDTQYPDELYRDFCRVDGDCLQQVPCNSGDCGVNERVLRTHKDGAFGGEMYKLGYKHATRNYYLRADYESIGEDFRADLGFIEKVDQRRAVAGGGYVWYPEQSWFNEVELGGDWDVTQNQNGEQIEQEWEGFLVAEGGWQSFWGTGWVTRDRVGKRLDGSSLAIEGNTTEFTETRVWLESSVAPVTWLSAGVEIGFGDEIDIANNRLGDSLDVETELELKLTDSLALELNHNYYALDVDDGRLLTANLTDVRLNWQLSVESFIRLSSIYTHIERDPSLYLYQTPDRLSEDLGTELLYGYKLNPLSVFYLGYGDNMVSDDTYPGLTRTEQTLFMKMSYAFIL
ncbi:carbohydrate binding family 9 domain-containing protein [Shewanella sp. JM162201]|uniref:Carbohydrate binding family 9 domain-containing protein n=2 Tax=Shewanella jiangmenensis TaxID=2837387 RepID=A0ABS5V5N7_9GAMM|nr:carbohydrate binding family 9 domain-containing protein [Shewanella jiangmenensis]